MASVDVAMFTQILVALAEFAMAFAVLLSIREVRGDRKRIYLEKRLEEFYIPLINLFSHGNLKRDYHIHDKVEEIVVSKRHLCGKKVATIMHPHFTAMRASDGDFYFHFSDEEEWRRWLKIADTIWDEYIEVLKEYYRIIGIKHYMLPQKPEEWMSKLGIPLRSAF
jgi:regulator of sigma D